MEDPANTTFTTKAEQEEAMGRPLAAHTPLRHWVVSRGVVGLAQEGGKYHVALPLLEMGRL